MARPSYRSLGNRVAIYTGNPAVSGWQFHQEQQRVKFGPLIGARHADITTFYSTEDVVEARRILRKYDVDWVIVGDEERFNYPIAGMAKFHTGLNGTLELAYQNGPTDKDDSECIATGSEPCGMQIWRVIPEDELTVASATP
jgi:uncharacterized membrane protein